MRRLVFKNFRIVDETACIFASLAVEDGLIRDILPANGRDNGIAGDLVIDGRSFGENAVLMPAFVDLHAHFRDPVFPKETSFPKETPSPAETSSPAETVESASLAAAAGGFGTLICMANTKPVIDTIEKARAVKDRSDALGLIDLYPVLALTRNMEGRELSGIKDLPAGSSPFPGLPLMLSEDGRDVASDGLFLAAMREARRIGVPVSCHCDFGGGEAEAAKAAGLPRAEWSRIEENNATRRAIDLGKRAGCHVHIAHVSTAEAAALIREVKNSPQVPGFTLTCEAAPHHIAATEADACRMGAESFGRVNPPLRSEADRQALVGALHDGIIDAVATDHAPHREADKAAGAPGFTGLETAFAACYSTLTSAAKIAPDDILRRLSALMSANPARILGLESGPRGRGRIAPGLRADLVIADTGALWKVDPARFRSRGKCGPFTGRELRGRILMTVRAGRIVFEGEDYAQYGQTL